MWALGIMTVFGYFLKVNVGVARDCEVSQHPQVSPVLSLSPHATIL